MGIYLIASFVPMGLNLLLMPLFSIYMEKRDFAIVSYFNSFHSLLFPFILFYLNQYYMREFFYRDEREKEILYANMYKSFLFIPFIGAAVSSIMIFLYMCFFNADSTLAFFPYGPLTFFSIAFTGLYYIEQVELKNRRNAKGFLFIILFYSLTNASVSAVLVALMQLNALGRVLGVFIASVAVFVLLLLKNWKRIRDISIDWKLLKDAVLFCYPLVLAAMLGFFSNGLDKVILEKNVPIDQLGIYAIGFTIGGALSVFSTSIGNTFSPDILESLAQKNFRRMFKFAMFQLVIMFFVVLIFVFSAKILIILFTANRYVEATTVARITAFGALTSIMYSVVSNILFSYKKTYLFVYTKIIGSIICLGMYMFLIERFKIIGAAIGYVCGNIVFSIVASTLLIISLKKDKKRLL